MNDDVSGVSGSFVDPLKLKPIHLNVGTVQYLIEKRYFPVHASSPLVPLSKLEVPSSEKNGKELPGIGLPAEPAPNARLTGKGRAYLDSLMIAATPEGRLEYSELQVSGPGSMTMDFVMGRGKAAIVDIDTNGLSLSPSIPYNDLLKPMARHLANVELGWPPLNVWQSQLRTLGWVFTNILEMPRKLFEARAVEGAKLSPADATKLTDDFLKNKLLVPKGDNLALNPQLKAFVERSSIGVIVELLATQYDANGGKVDRRELRLFGNPNDRITVATLTGKALKAAVGDKPLEPALISITSQGRDAFRIYLESFLGIVGP